MKWFAKLPLARQILILATLACSVVFSSLVAYVAYATKKVALAQTEAALSSQLRFVADAMEFNYSNQAARAESAIGAFRKRIKASPALTGALLKAEKGEVPELKAGEVSLNDNSALLSEFSSTVGAELAVMARMGDDFVRASTMLRDKDGRSMVGVKLPSTEPTVIALLQGKAYSGLLVRNGKYYLSRFEPLVDSDKKVIGAISIRFDLTDEISRLKTWIGSVKVAKTGYFFGLSPVDDQAKVAQYIMHPANEGKFVGDLDAATKERLSRVIANRGGVEFYQWPDKAKDNAPNTKIAVYTMVKGWDWVLGGGSFVDEFLDDSVALRNALAIMSLIGAIAMVLLIQTLVASRVRRFDPALRTIEMMGRGDLTASTHSDSTSANEADRMGSSIDAARLNMSSLVQGICASMERLSTSSTSLASAAKGSSAAAQKQTAAATSVVASVEELSVSVSRIADSAAEAESICSGAASDAKHGATAIFEAVFEIRKVADALGATGAQIAAIGASSAEIVTVVEAIRGIASQTNLLALNAAIEAARAGESGRGFAVVADEVKKLAENSRSATERIEGMIGKIRSDTAKAVEGMHGMGAAMAGGMQKAEAAGAALGKIAQSSEATVQAVRDIARSSDEQRSTSHEIALSVERIAEAAESASATIAATSEATATLTEMTSSLRDTVSQFKT